MQAAQYTPVSVLRAAVPVGLVAAMLNFVVFFAARAVGVDFVGEFQPGAGIQPIPVPMIGVSTQIGAVIGSLLLWRLGRRPGGVRLFTIIAGLFAVLSVGGPVGLVGASVGTKVALGVMHIVAGAVITPGLVRFGRA